MTLAFKPSIKKNPSTVLDLTIRSRAVACTFIRDLFLMDLPLGQPRSDFGGLT